MVTYIGISGFGCDGFDYKTKTAEDLMDKRRRAIEHDDYVLHTSFMQDNNTTRHIYLSYYGKILIVDCDNDYSMDGKKYCTCIYYSYLDKSFSESDLRTFSYILNEDKLLQSKYSDYTEILRTINDMID